MPLALLNGDEESAWSPPQLASLVGAWVQGLSGNVAPLGTWAGQYGTTGGMAMQATAQVASDGLAQPGVADFAVGPLATPVTAAWAMALWVRPSGIAGVQVPVYNGLGATNGYGIYTTAGIWRVLLGGVNDVNVATPVDIGTWHHLAATRRGGSLYWYYDGVEYDQNVATVPNAPTTATYMGATSATTIYPMSGRADGVYIWSTSLLASEIADVFTNDPHKRAVGT